MNRNEMTVDQLRTGIAEMESAIDRLRDEIQQLQAEREALKQGNLELYHKLTSVEF